MDTLTSLKAFRQVVESGSFVAAAERLTSRQTPFTTTAEVSASRTTSLTSSAANAPSPPRPSNNSSRRYELAIQTAFREASDALSVRGTYVKQYEAQQAPVAGDAEAYKLSQMRFRSGVDNYLATPDAERSLYTAQQQLVKIREAELANRVTLYKALGGGWEDRMVSRR